MSVTFSKAKYVLMVGITLMMSSTSFAVFGGPLEKLDCRSYEASVPSLFSMTDAMDAIRRPYFENGFRDYLCSKTGTLSYIDRQNQIIAKMNDQDSNPMLRELGAAYRKLRPDLALEPLQQYCAKKITLDQAIDGYRANASREEVFGKEVDRITGEYDYSSEAPCGHRDKAYDDLG